jgi:hypothetical protein
MTESVKLLTSGASLLQSSGNPEGANGKYGSASNLHNHGAEDAAAYSRPHGITWHAPRFLEDNKEQNANL